MTLDMPVRVHLHEIRESRGVSAAKLARTVGVSRQTIYAIEDGTFLPNTTVSLQLARALDVTVEQLFSIADDEQPGKPVKADLLPGHHVDNGQLVRLCRVNDRLVAIPMPFLPAYLPRADGVINSRTRDSVSIHPPASLPEHGQRLLLAGCDPALSLLSEGLQTFGIEVIAAPASSRRALEWLKQGKVHAAGSHLLDRSTGDYNLPMIRRLLRNASVRVITFAVWEQGLVVRRANPKAIRSIADLARRGVTLINREPGSGSRDLLDNALRQLGVPSKQVKGYHSIAQGHLAAAYAIASGAADCCIAPRCASRCFGLDFIPLAVERFDLSFTQASLQLPAANAVLDLLNRSSLRKRLQRIAGYDTAHTGRILI